jgi:hypothetical protein
MPERLLYVLAKEYCQSPGDVENWEPFHLNRAIILLEAEAELRRREEKKRK